MPSYNTSLRNYETLTNTQSPIIHDSSLGSTVKIKSSETTSSVLDSQQLKFKLDASSGGIIIDRLCEYILLLRNMEMKHSRAEAKYHELEKLRNTELDTLSREMQALRETCEKSRAETDALKKELEQLKDLEKSEGCAQATTATESSETVVDMEFKPIYRSPEDMMKTRFDILSRLPVPTDDLVDVLKPIGIPERFTLHEFLLGSASGSLKNALAGYCAFTENTLMWCPQREEHGFYLTPLYKCDTGPRSNVIHRWVKVDVKARMPKPTECFYKKDDEWYYTGTYQPFRLEDLTPKEYENLSQATRDALVKETLAGRKNTTPQIFFETSQLYAAGALKVAVVGIQCVGFNRMLYSVALQQAQRFQASRGDKIVTEKDTPTSGIL